MQTQNLNIEQRLMSLTLLENQKPSSTIMGSVTSSPPSSSSSLIGDYIGIESCLDLKENDDIFSSSSSLNQEKQEEEDKIESLRQRRNERDRGMVKKKEFPPPIPLLARTENLPSHMPWVLKRYYTDDGRLILREERVKHHEYFRAQRCNGRLILRLILLDDEVHPPPFASHELDTGDCSSEQEQEQEQEEEEEETVCEDEKNSSAIGGNASNFNCFNYSTMRQSSTSIFEMLVPAVRPIRS